MVDELRSGRKCHASRYFVAEGLACGQAVHWVSPIACNSEPLQGLPQVVEPSAVVPVSQLPAKSSKQVNCAHEMPLYVSQGQ